MPLPADPLTLILTVAALLAPLDLVRSGFSLERARAHDRAILRLLVVATVVVGTVDLVASMVLILGVLGWSRERSLRNLLLAAGFAAIWLVAPLLQPYAWVIALGWLTIALLEALITFWFWGVAKRWWICAVSPITRWQIHRGMPPTHPNLLGARIFSTLGVAERLPLWPLAGIRGQHTLFAAFLAILLPLAWALYPGLGVLWVLMLVGISSWVGVLAGLAGLAVVEPWLAPVIGALILAVLALLAPRILDDHATLLDLLPRGDSLDSVKERGRTWWFLLGTMRRWSWRTWLTGRGWDGTNQDLLRAHALRRVTHTQGTAHNDILDLIYTSGLLGVLLLGVLTWHLAPALTLRDPWSAVVVTGVVIALGSSALRYPSIGLCWWLACAFVANGGRS